MLKCEDATNLQKGSYVAGLNEHVGAGARDRLEDIGLYYKSSNLDFPRSQLVFTLWKMAGRSKNAIFKILAIYVDDRERHKNDEVETFDDDFFLLTVKRGVQEHWDFLANSARDSVDVSNLKSFVQEGSGREKFERRGLNPWVPDL